MPTQCLVPGKSISPSIPGAVGVSCSCCSKWPQIRWLEATVPAVRSISGRKPRCWWDGAPSRGPQGDSSPLSQLLVAIGTPRLGAPWLQCTPLWSHCLLLFRLCVCLLCAVTKFKLHLDNRGWAHLKIFNCVSAKVLFFQIIYPSQFPWFRMRRHLCKTNFYWLVCGSLDGRGV